MRIQQVNNLNLRTKHVGGRNPRRQCFSVAVTKGHGWYLKVKMVIWANTGDEEMSPQDVYLNK